MDDEQPLPAENIGAVDLTELARRYPEQIAEIAQLAELYQSDAESPAEFRRLCELLHACGQSHEAEYLLRRHLREEADRELYQRLFGARTAEALQQAVAAFSRSFGVSLTLYQEWAFLDHEYESAPQPGEHARPAILNRSCLVRVSFTRREFVTAAIVARGTTNDFDAASMLNLRFQDGRWQPLDITRRTLK
jgi:hypothetical protein